MPQQKDFKRLVRARMGKTGESYTAARLQLVSKSEPNYEELAGMSNASVHKVTARSWREWVHLLDAAGAASKPHREIAKLVSSLGAPSWWSQMIAVGYERIRGLRDRGQQRGGGYTATKSRTFNVPVQTLFDAIAKHFRDSIRSSTRGKRMRLAWPDGTHAVLGFYPKGKSKSSVAVEHGAFADKAAAESMKKTWSEHFDQLARLLA